MNYIHENKISSANTITQTLTTTILDSLFLLIVPSLLKSHRLTLSSFSAQIPLSCSPLFCSLFLHPSFWPFGIFFLSFLPTAPTSVPALITFYLQHYMGLQLLSWHPLFSIGSLGASPQHTHYYNINLQDGDIHSYLPAPTSSLHATANQIKFKKIMGPLQLRSSLPSSLPMVLSKYLLQSL